MIAHSNLAISSYSHYVLDHDLNALLRNQYSSHCCIILPSYSVIIIRFQFFCTGTWWDWTPLSISNCGTPCRRLCWRQWDCPSISVCWRNKHSWNKFCDPHRKHNPFDGSILCLWYRISKCLEAFTIFLPRHSNGQEGTEWNKAHSIHDIPEAAWYITKPLYNSVTLIITRLLDQQ